MILNKSNEVFEYEGKKFKIGDEVIVNSVDADYEGLIGVITEIRDGEDKETDNETPDIYCNFFEPVIPAEIEQLEKRFSAIFQEPRKLEDINLDQVIMAPEMIDVIAELEKETAGKIVYTITDDWAAHGEHDTTVEVRSNLRSAKVCMREMMRKAVKYGGVFEHRGEECFVEDTSEMTYHAYIEGFDESTHYWVCIQEKQIR